VSDNPQYARNEKMLFGQSGSDTFMMSVDTGFYYALNETASRVWQILELPRTKEDIVAALVSEYHVDAGRCREEIGAFLTDLVTRAILLTS